jgi:hypothetical protein
VWCLRVPGRVTENPEDFLSSTMCWEGCSVMEVILSRILVPNGDLSAVRSVLWLRFWWWVNCGILAGRLQQVKKEPALLS